MPDVQRRLSAGVEVLDDGRVHARVWAPSHRTVEWSVDGSDRWHALTEEAHGFFSGFLAGAQPGTRYWYRIDSGPPRPDPASRFQPDGPHGPSEIVASRAFRWSDSDWRGVTRSGQVVYEMHIGTFTPEGTWAAAEGELERLRDLGVTIVEMMPVADFSGRFGWGYDGVNLYAPSRLYGTPDDLRRFIDRSHGLGLGVILDVVYNHLGPDGNYLGDFASEYFTDKYKNDWGQAINFEGPLAARNYFIENACYWIDEFHFDGLRIDATQDMHDESREHVLAEMARRARAAAGSRSILLVAENEPQLTALARPAEEGGFGLDALWNDDFHHTAVVALTGRREAYYSDYRGSPQEFISCAKYGYLYQGQWYRWQQQRRGTPSGDLPGCAFVAYLENHDQVANSAFGRRLHQLSSPGHYRAIAALTLLGPATPMLFQGQEFASSRPFLYFADHRPDLREPVTSGRREFLTQFANIADPEVVSALPSPVEPSTFERCKLDPAERERHAEAIAFHRDLLTLRREDPVLRAAGMRRVDGALIASDAFIIRYFGGADGDRLLVVNLGCDLDLRPGPEPLLAPPEDCSWSVVWSSEAVRYGGQGTAPLKADAEWHVPGEAAVLLSARANDECSAGGSLQS